MSTIENYNNLFLFSFNLLNFWFLLKTYREKKKHKYLDFYFSIILEI